MSKITQTEIYHLTKEQNYMRGYEDGSKDTREEAYQQGRADAIDEVERELLTNGFIATHHALDVWHEMAKQLKEQTE